MYEFCTKIYKTNKHTAIKTTKTVDTKADGFKIKASMKVGDAEKLFDTNFGVTVQIKKNGKLVPNEMTIGDAINFFQEHGQKRIADSLQPLQDVGLAYIKLGQSSSTLSGGENQRVKLAYYLSRQSDRPTMFIFDEPTTGLHFHDIKKLLKSFERLLERGHSLVVIEHNMDVIKCADYLIDLGPEGGEDGGNLIAAGTPEEVAACKESYTGEYLREKLG